MYLFLQRYYYIHIQGLEVIITNFLKKDIHSVAELILQRRA